LAERVRQSVSEASRLLVDPDLFRALPHRHPRVRSVEVRLSRGRFASEASRLHADAYYDVILHLDASAGDSDDELRIDWEDPTRTLAAVEARRGGSERSVLVAKVPLLRNVTQAKTLDGIEVRAAGLDTVADLRRELASGGGEDLEAFRELAARFRFTLDRIWSG